MNLIKFIKNNSESLTELIELLPIPIFYKDREGVYLGCNKAFEGFVKLPREEVIGKTAYELLSKKEADLYFQKDQELFNNPGIQIFDGKAASSENDSYIVRFHKATFKNDKGEITGLIGVVFDITKEVMQEKYLDKLASYDELTELHNRRKGMLLLEEQIEKSKGDNIPFSVVMMDIDHFKKINDTYGHSYGDEILKEISQVLKNNLRDHDIVFRHGGEEFIYCLPKTDKEEAFLVSERIRQSILKKFKNYEKNGCRHVTASFGIATFLDDGDSVHHLINRADHAMYKVKTSGRNGVGFADIR
ncbi:MULTISPECIES: GGDEF domain-containing protein [Psychrilyobacter]|uniref:Diguanylate cyclase n=1 Tax=Psychrilyobacter piezotolerans TaxID=2293438 RepID=A0ABX9KIJ7_9FUSO|nr:MULTISPECIES: GGDEF domain-containing protein [Psychrilyobacter]MCS5421363.1 diguanylate cyclase [Psychrilyobacter sp. S5]NDI77490.1 diguanylate cyclase [Psychrilyobacter piezotolerans]RDE62995.1 sensor domain-containing diguanylate cyclase [Psychrilyobacter sp. S5]REI41753.1 diguanylate cyclase [Psychrilyobacter piezotolerans]